MTFLTTSLAVLGLFVAWGLGLAVLVLPRRWRHHWPVLAPLAGIGAISLVAWLAGHAGAAGTDAWVLPGWLVPAGLIALATWQSGATVWWRGVRGYAGLAALAVGVVVAATWPLQQSRLGITTVSLGSCDAADYAAGARLLKEFAHADRAGFVGEVEVVKLHSVENFHDHWLRLNHYTPAALVAWLASATGMKIHELVTATSVALLAAGALGAFWAARVLLRYPAWASLLVAACCGLGGANLYAVAHAALGQQLAAPAVVLLTWGGVRLWQRGGSWCGALAAAPVCLLALWIIFGGYHFFILFAPAPVVAWWLWRLARSRDWARAGRTAAVAAGALAVAAVLAWDRTRGLAERFLLFEEFDFGWRIPVFGPERWLGWFGDAELQGPGPGWAWAAAAAYGGVWLAAAVRAARTGPDRLARALAGLVPAAAGYVLLASGVYVGGVGASYDAYKVFAVFLPLILAALALPLAGGAGRAAAVAAGGLLLIGYTVGGQPLREALRRPPLVVDRALAQVAAVEAWPEVASLNLRLEPFWARLWANGFLLRKPQYFATYTYEGRRPTPLRGEWDLRETRLLVRPDGGDAFRPVNELFHLWRAGRDAGGRATPGAGWAEWETGGGRRWVWATANEAAVELALAGTGRRRVLLRGELRAAEEREVALAVGDRIVWTGRVGPGGAALDGAVVELGAGEHRLVVRSPQPPSRVAGDTRPLLVAWHNPEIVLGAAER